MQEFLRVLPEIPDQQAHVAGQSCQVVVELRVREQLSSGGGVVIQLRGSGRKVRTCFAQLFVKRVVRHELAQRALARTRILQHGVAVRHGLFGLVVKRWVGDQFA